MPPREGTEHSLVLQNHRSVLGSSSTSLTTPSQEQPLLWEQGPRVSTGARVIQGHCDGLCYSCHHDRIQNHLGEKPLGLTCDNPCLSW